MVKKRKMYLGARGNGKSTISMQRAAVDQPSYTYYREFITLLGGKPRSWFWFKFTRLRRWWIIKQIEWRINHG